jgi:tripartite-type tricarboxylate transporter receptor subunit TctC
MARTLGQQFIIENVVGAGGTTGSLHDCRSVCCRRVHRRVVATERHPILPNVPTTIEAGLPEFQALPWWALFAPKGVPQPILDALTDALDKALDDEQLRKRFSDLGGDIPGKERRGQQPLAALVKSEIARWTPIIKAANVTIG